MTISFDTGSKKGTAFRFQYSGCRQQCPVCGKQKSLILEQAPNGRPPWGYCFGCHSAGPLRYLETGVVSRMRKQLVLQGFMNRANQEFLITSGDGACRGILGIPFRADDPLRRFYDAFIGYAPMRTLAIMFKQLHIRPTLEGGTQQFWKDRGLVIAIQDWPGRITGFLCLAPSGNRLIWLHKSNKGVCFLRLRPTERNLHFDSLQNACAKGTMYSSLDIDINLTCDPVL